MKDVHLDMDPESGSEYKSAQDEERALSVWKGIKTTLYPLLNEPRPEDLWENARSKLWSHYEMAGLPHGEGDDGFWLWLEEQNRLISRFRTPEENQIQIDEFHNLKEKLQGLGTKR